MHCGGNGRKRFFRLYNVSFPGAVDVQPAACDPHPLNGILRDQPLQSGGAELCDHLYIMTAVAGRLILDQLAQHNLEFKIIADPPRDLRKDRNAGFQVQQRRADMCTAGMPEKYGFDSIRV